jgi:hypothetical protein
LLQDCIAISPQRVGGDIFFGKAALTVRDQTFFRHDEEHHLGQTSPRVEIISSRNNDGMTVAKNGIKASFQTRYFEFGVAGF